MNPIITIQNLKKSYLLGNTKIRHNTLRDEIVAGITLPFSQVAKKFKQLNDGLPQTPKKTNEIWALKDINLNIFAGEVVGIIGHNGAGKSTLLKILSRITDPTEGRVMLYGRVGSLLEVGTGFHPELTGRENIFLNGAILGMSRKEIIRKFDEIIAFSEIEKFLDTPVKRYSSGMYTRLAFAVAAHLDPEIMLVDEVLAVGDANFQKKCLGKMDDISRLGRTILFVSHNMNAIQRLCPRSILLHNGQVKLDGKTSDVIGEYLSLGMYLTQPDSWVEFPDHHATGTSGINFLRAKYSSNHPALSGRLYSGGPLECQFEIYSPTSHTIGSMAVTIYDLYGTKLINADLISLGEVINLHPGVNHISYTIKNLHLNPGVYLLGLWAANPPGEVYDHISSAIKFEVFDLAVEQLGARPNADGVIPCEFKVEILV